MSGLLERLKSRRVYTTVTAYVVGAWLIVQVADTVFPIYEVPDWLLRALTTVLAVAFPLVVLLAFSLERADAPKRPPRQTSTLELDPR